MTGAQGRVAGESLGSGGGALPESYRTGNSHQFPQSQSEFPYDNQSSQSNQFSQSQSEFPYGNQSSQSTQFSQSQSEFPYDNQFSQSQSELPYDNQFPQSRSVSQYRRDTTLTSTSRRHRTRHRINHYTAHCLSHGEQPHTLPLPRTHPPHPSATPPHPAPYLRPNLRPGHLRHSDSHGPRNPPHRQAPASSQPCCLSTAGRCTPAQRTPSSYSTPARPPRLLRRSRRPHRLARSLAARHAVLTPPRSLTVLYHNINGFRGGMEAALTKLLTCTDPQPAHRSAVVCTGGIREGSAADPGSGLVLLPRTRLHTQQPTKRRHLRHRSPDLPNRALQLPLPSARTRG